MVFAGCLAFLAGLFFAAFGVLVGLPAGQVEAGGLVGDVLEECVCGVGFELAVCWRVALLVVEDVGVVPELVLSACCECGCLLVDEFDGVAGVGLVGVEVELE